MIHPRITANINGIDQPIDLFSKMYMTRRTIYFFDEVTNDTAANLIIQLQNLAEQSADDIFLYINSPGGSVHAGLAIYDAMRSLGCDVNTIATGVAASMGAFLVSAGTNGKRYATPEAEIMIHQPLGGAQGQATDISLVADHIQRLKKKLASIMAESCGKPAKVLLRDMERDNWKTAEEAKKYGLVDHVGFPDQFEEE